MKKGDIIARDITLEIGTSVLHNVSSPERAKAYMETDFLQQYGIIPSYKIELNPETGHNDIVLTQAVIQHEEAVVNWVIEGEVAIQYKDGNYRIFTETDEPEWKVIVESVPSYQSSVENLTEEQLRQAIDDLRQRRTVITTKPKRTVTKIDTNDPVAKALSTLTPEKKMELMRKLGMID